MASILHPRSRAARNVLDFLRGEGATARGVRLALGAWYGIIAVGLILIYRTNRIINFAAAALGAVPAIFALLLDVQHGISYLAVLPIAVVGGLLCGALVDIVIMRRFQRSPRL